MPESSSLRRQTDAVIAAFGLPVTHNNLCLIAEEMRRRVHIFPGGWVTAERIVREIEQRALELA